MARGAQRGTFGLTSRGRGRGSFRSGGYRGGGSSRGGRGRGGSRAAATTEAPPVRDDEGAQSAEKFEQTRLNDEIDEKLGFARLQEGFRKEGWLVNMHPVC
jgi:DNA polymerase epsilon subunit 1